MACNGNCKQGRQCDCVCDCVCDSDEPLKPLDFTLASRLVLAVVAVAVAFLIALVGAMWRG